MFPPKNRTVREGFTLIELLVVIAIIAILSAILFPVFASARAKARQISCLSNQKQIVLGFYQYAQDYDETMPVGRRWGACVGDAPSGFVDGLSPYIEKVASATKGGAGSGASIWKCPVDDIEPAQFFTSSYGIASVKKMSYAINSYWQNPTWDPEKLHAYPFESNDVNPCGGSGNYQPGRALAEFPAPANVILLAETRSNWVVYGHDENQVLCPGDESLGAVSANGFCQVDESHNSQQVWASGTTKVGKPFHSEGWNYGFADGHVKWFRPRQTVGNGALTYPYGLWTLREND